MHPRNVSKHARVLLSFVLLLALPLGWIACGSDDGGSSTLGNEPSISVEASPSQAAADGSPVTLNISALEGPGKPGWGSIAINAPRGSINGGSNDESISFQNGQATAQYACDAAQDPGCVGMQTVTVTWKGISDDTGVYFTGVAAEAGPDAPPDAPEDSPTDVLTDVPEDVSADVDLDGAIDADPDGGEAGLLPSLSLSAADQQIFSDVGDTTLITAVLALQGDGGFLEGEEVVFTTNLGLLAMPGGGPPDPATSQSVVTGANGEAQVLLTDNGVDGLATITALHVNSGVEKETYVDILRVQQISHKSTTCLGATCTIMGIKGSGFNEQAQVAFSVVDSNGNPAAGVPVTFSIANPPSGTTVTPSGTTDAAGTVVTNVSAGPTIGAFTVRAVAIPGLVEVESPTIGIRGAKAANRGFSLQCSPVNIGAYVSPTPPKEFQIDCDVKLVDRYNNPVGRATVVSFLVEAGSIPSTTTTKPYNPSGTNTDEGTGTVKFSTIGTWPADDVTPLPADSTQWPVGRDAEPARMIGAAQHNPRDGLVSVLGYVRGEEFFQDDNSNGTRDTDEMFVDQGEPFVDRNDNGIRDPGEYYVDEAPADGMWNPPNGQWDNDTSIWVETRILYTGVPMVAHSMIVPSNFGDVNKLEVVTLNAYFADLNVNRPQAQGTTIAMTDTATKGSVAWKSGNPLDGYGFGMERRLLDASTNTECTATSEICIWRMLFFDWGEGYLGFGEVTGAPLSDNTPAQNDTVRIEATVLLNKVTIEAVGSIL